MDLKTRLLNEDSPKIPIAIRKANENDYAAVSALEEMELAYHQAARPDYFTSSESKYTREEFQESLSHPCPICWLAIYAETVVGLCFGKIEKTPGSSVCKSRLVAFIQDIVTLPEYQGKGVATALLSKAKEQAICERAVSMELCVWNFNHEAILLYEKMGMQVQYYRMEEKLVEKND